jgi:hypothetical protein
MGMLLFERRSGDRTGIRRWTLAAAGTLAAVTAFAWPGTPALAGTYHVYSCRTPSGAPAPADGWSGSVVGAESFALDTCEHGGVLSATLGEEPGRLANADSATWEFAPPVGERLVGATLWRAGDADGGQPPRSTYIVWLAGPEQGFPFDECDFSAGCETGIASIASTPLSAANRVLVGPANRGGNLYATATCRGVAGYPCAEGQGDANGYAAALYVYAADITLEQGAGPSVGSVGGELASAGTVSGTSELSVSASDPGAGVYEVSFKIDGQVVNTVPDENGGRCREASPAADGLHTFLYVKPCPASVNAQVGLDTTRFANGTHHLVISVIDAAGNTATVLERNLTFQNAGMGAANGTNPSSQATLAVRWAKTSKATVMSPFGQAQTVIGRLTGPGGDPIAAAAIDVSAIPAYTGAHTVAMSGVRTDAGGNFTVRIPGGVSSRTIQLAYRSHLGDALPAVARTLALRVRAGISLRVSPHVTGVGETIRFRGQLRGGPVPHDGKQLVLEARSPGSRWIQFDDVLTDAKGRFRATYRFKFPGPAHYQFRAVSEPESDYPFAEGASNVVGVYER